MQPLWQYFAISIPRQIVKQNIFEQLEITSDKLQEHVRVFLEGKRRQTIDFSFDSFIRDCTKEIAEKEKRREYYTTALNTHLITNKISLNPNIYEIFIVDFNGKVIASTDKNRIGEDVSSKKYFSQVELLSTFTGDPHYDSNLEEVVIEISAVVLSKIEQEAIGVLVNRIEFEREEDRKGNGASAQEDYERRYSQLIDVNKVWARSFSSDGFIKRLYRRDNQKRR